MMTEGYNGHGEITMMWSNAASSSLKHTQKLIELQGKIHL